jgi:hypothetical protein
MEMEDEGFIPHGINIGKTVLSLEDDSKIFSIKKKSLSPNLNSF